MVRYRIQVLEICYFNIYLRGNIFEVCAILIVIFERPMELFIVFGGVVSGGSFALNIIKHVILPMELDEIPVLHAILSARG